MIAPPPIPTSPPRQPPAAPAPKTANREEGPEFEEVLHKIGEEPSVETTSPMTTWARSHSSDSRAENIPFSDEFNLRNNMWTPEDDRFHVFTVPKHKWGPWDGIRVYCPFTAGINFQEVQFFGTPKVILTRNSAETCTPQNTCNNLSY